MQRRACERIASNLKVRFTCCDTYYEGAVTNLSENGMYITTNKMSFPFEYQLTLLLSTEHDVIKVDAKVSRMTKSMNDYDGMGVKVLNPTEKYTEFVNSLKTR